MLIDTLQEVLHRILLSGVRNMQMQRPSERHEGEEAEGVGGVS